MEIGIFGRYDEEEHIEKYGPEKVINGDFGSSVGWTATGSWSIVGGLAINVGGVSNLYRNIGAVVGEVYEIRFELVEYTSGSMHITVSGKAGTSISGLGVYVEKLGAIITIVDNNIYCASEGSAFIGKIDNVSVRKVL